MDMTGPILPDAFRNRVLQMHGDTGACWLDGLPELISNLSDTWALSVGSPFDLSYNYVAPARGPDGESLVLKIAVSGDRQIAREAAALMRVSDSCSVRLVTFDGSHGAMLTERAMPGDSLSVLADRSDHAASEAIGEIFECIWNTSPDATDTSLSSVMEETFLPNLQLPESINLAQLELIEGARVILRRLSLEAEESTFLHGDLHHGNLLSAQRSPWLMIDPKAMVGERCFDVAGYVISPLRSSTETPNRRELMVNRSTVLAGQLGLDPSRILSWAFIRAVAAELWNIEDHGTQMGTGFQLAETLEEIIG